VALGNVIYDFENPDVLIMGQSDEKYGDIGESIYRKILKNNAPIVKMSLIESEICKVSLNAYITMKISFANFLGNISEKLNCNPKNITKALGYDKRISPFYLNSGLSFGGTCFPRDTWAFINLSEKLGLTADHIIATQKINENQNKLLIEKVSQFKDKVIGIFGLSFKPKTSVTTESASFILYEYLIANNYYVLGCDDLVHTDFTTENFDQFVKKCDVIVLAHINLPLFQEHMEQFKTKIVIDPWNILK
jgi:UDPglucose 6-dehydrogenase